MDRQIDRMLFSLRKHNCWAKFTIVLEFRCPRKTCCTNGRGSRVACLPSFTARRLRNISCIWMAARWCSMLSLSQGLLPAQHHTTISTAIYVSANKKLSFCKQKDWTSVEEPKRIHRHSPYKIITQMIRQTANNDKSFNSLCPYNNRLTTAVSSNPIKLTHSVNKL